MAALKKLVSNVDTLQPRTAPRRRLQLSVDAISGSAGVPNQAMLLELSETGFLLEASECLAAGDVLELILPDAGAVEAEIVWSEGQRHGGRFSVPLSRAVVSASLLKAPALQGLVTEVSSGEVASSSYSPRTKVAIWLGLGVISWAAVIGALSLLF